MLKFKNVNIILIVFFTILVLFKIENLLLFWWGILILWIIITTIGSFHIRWNYFLEAKHKNKLVSSNTVALTFDDGPNANYTLKVLTLLKKHNAKATFFCIGKNVKKHPDILHKIVNEGHLIGNHSYNHHNLFGFFSSKKIIEELEQTKKIIKEKVDLKVVFFRPPFGVTNPNIAKAVKKLELKTFGWSIRSLDTMAKDPEKTYKKIISKIKKGDVLLMHDTNELSISVLEKVLHYLDENNFKTTTLDKLFNLKPYE